MQNSNNIDRRTLIQNLLRGGLALGLVPGFAQSAWGTVAAGGPAGVRALSAAQTGMVAIIADAILPRSDTPSATEVGVVPWIDIVVAEYFPQSRRAGFLADLTAIDDFALAKSGAQLSALKADALGALIGSLDAAYGSSDRTPAQRGYVQLKELVVYGYFTSRTVQQDILKVVIVPGRFDGDVLVTPASAT
jgi:hypothetical protein